MESSIRKSQSLPQRYKSVNETTQYSKLALKYNIQIMLLQHLDQLWFFNELSKLLNEHRKST